MKTKCYCVHCPTHPLFEKRRELDFPVGWTVGKVIWNPNELESGADVDCLTPESSAFDELYIDSEDIEYPITAYNDGSAETGFSGRAYEIRAYCGSEEYRE